MVRYVSSERTLLLTIEHKHQRCYAFRTHKTSCVLFLFFDSINSNVWNRIMVATAIVSTINELIVNELGQLILSQLIDQKQFDKKIALALVNKTHEGNNAVHYIKLKYVSQFTINELKKEYIAFTSKACYNQLLADFKAMNDAEISLATFDLCFDRK